MIKGNSNSSGIRTHVSEYIATWRQRHRPLGLPAYLVKSRRASVYVRDLCLASNALQKFVGYCKPLVQGQPELEKKWTLSFCQVSCILLKYAFTSACWSPFVLWSFNLLTTEWTLPFCFFLLLLVQWNLHNWQWWRISCLAWVSEDCSKRNKIVGSFALSSSYK